MRLTNVLTLGAALSLLGGGALAGMDGGSTATGAPPALDAIATVKADQDRPGHRGDWKRHGPKHGGQAGRKGPWHGAFARGPHIILERNGNRIDVQCAGRDTTIECVNAVKNLMEQIAGNTPGIGAGSAPSTPETPKAQP
jgi:hypothetical protein